MEPSAPREPDSERSHPTSEDLELASYLEAATADPSVRAEPPSVRAEPVEARARETIIILDFGSQYSMLIARRVRECHVYCELVPHDAPWEQVERLRLRRRRPAGARLRLQVRPPGPGHLLRHAAPRPPARRQSLPVDPPRIRPRRHPPRRAQRHPEPRGAGSTERGGGRRIFHSSKQRPRLVPRTSYFVPSYL